MIYLIPTPIGNLEDITLRAIRLLKEVDLILAEDTRVSSKLLKHFEIDTPYQSFHMHNEHKKVQSVLNQLKGGKKVALISDAGTPGISDPGFLMVREAIKEGIEVQCLPGPTALIPALVQSGIPCDRFVFEGFLPPKKGRNKRLEKLSNEIEIENLLASHTNFLESISEARRSLKENSISVNKNKISEINSFGCIS